MTNWNKVLTSAVAVVAVVATARAQNSANSADGQFARGESVFTYWCATCHGPGPGMPGTQALQAKYNGALPAILTERADLTPELIAFYVRNGISVMPFFRKTEVSDTDLEAISHFIVTSAGNN